MKKITLTLIAILFIPAYAAAQTVPKRVSFSVDSKNNKRYKTTISKIETAANSAAKEKCLAKTKFFPTAISINVGLTANAKYAGNANYTGECRSK